MALRNPNEYDWAKDVPPGGFTTDDYNAAVVQGIAPGVPSFTNTGLNSATGQAAAQNAAQKSANAAYRQQGIVQNSQARGQSVGTSRPTRGTQPVARSQDKAVPWGSSKEWFGGLDEYGGISAARSPQLLFDLYGTNVLGLQPGSAYGQFMGENYNPYAMSAVFGAGNEIGIDDQLAAGTWLANQIGQPGMTFFDPGTIVQKALSAIAQAGADPNNPKFSQLAGIASGDPMTQLDNLVSFLGEALAGSMTPEMLKTYLTWLQQQGMKIINQVMNSKAQGGGIAEFERGGGNIASHLLRLVGARGGL